MRERVESLVGRMVRVMWVMTFHSACARIMRSEAERLGYTSRFSIYDEADSLRVVRRCARGAEHRSQALHPARDQVADLGGQEPARGCERLSRARRLLLRADRRRRVRAVRAAHPRDERARLRRPAVPHGQRPGAVPRRRRALPADLPLDPGRRVPGHQPRPVPAAAAARRRAAQRLRRRRRRPVDLQLPRRGHLEHPRLRARLPGRARREARAELPLDADDPVRRERSRLAQPGAQAQGAVERHRRRRARAGRRARRRARRGAPRRGGDRAAERGGRDLPPGHRGLLPDERAEPRARGHAGAVRRLLPGDRRHQVLRARRDQGRARISVAAHEPGRHGVVRPRDQLAAARHRADDAGAPARLCEHDGHPGAGGRLRRGRRAGPCRPLR